MKFVGVCEYDGSSFSGFQSQSNATSVQDALEKAIASVGHITDRMNYSGRTDAGVHALGQVFDFQSSDIRTIDQWLKGINSALPETMAVTFLQEIYDNFHSRFDAIKRKYAYIIYTGSTRPVFLKDYVFWEKNILDFDVMKTEAAHLIGTHNFSSFRGSKCTANNPIRTIEFINIQKLPDFMIITISANAYLYNMVRIIVGTLIDIATGRLQESMLDILNTESRLNAGKTAQSQGLFFLGAEYKDLKFPDQMHNSSLFNLLKRPNET
ncbi:tRNA pseudouridine(38-40) synthase TruA [Gammaproteobacteria bacterium]|nr:tRNA pseudouridine(38-40) synthase TruA [Gammaproteobacteria bacterium]